MGKRRRDVERKTKNWEYYNFVSLETLFLIRKLRLQYATCLISEAHENVVVVAQSIAS